MSDAHPLSARRSLPVLVAAAIVAVTTVLSGGPASACSLAGEDVRVEPSEVAPGGEVTVSGEDIYYFASPLGADCSGLEPYSGPATLGMVVRGGSPTVVELGEIVVSADSAIEPTLLTIPADAPPGTHSLVLLIDDSAGPESSYPARNDITIAQPPTSSSTTSSTSTVPPTTPSTAPAPRSPAAPRFTG